MKEIKPLRLPLSEGAVRSLRVGDFVLLTGEIVITAGLTTHERILECINANRALPIDLSEGALFHLGSYSREVNGAFEVLYMNPTTSTRFNSFMPTFIRRFRLRAVGGKGGLDLASAQAMQEVGCVYLSFLGGGCALHSDAIRRVIEVAWSDLIAHYRLVKLQVEDLGPLVVAIDSTGASVYDALSRSAGARLPQILRDLDTARSGGNSPSPKP